MTVIFNLYEDDQNQRVPHKATGGGTVQWEAWVQCIKSRNRGVVTSHFPRTLTKNRWTVMVLRHKSHKPPIFSGQQSIHIERNEILFKLSIS